MLNWDQNDENKYDISNIVKQMVPPVGARALYQPGEEGFAERDLTQPAGGTPPRQAINLSSTAGPQDRLTQLESTYPGGAGALPVMDERPSASSVSPISTDTAGAPKYQVPQDMMSYFDDVVKTLTGSSQNVDQLRNMSQGFGLIGLGPKEAAQARIGATKALADVEGMKRNAAANLAHTLSYLMTDPSKFNMGVWGKQLEYNLGNRGAGVSERKMAVEEAKAPWEIQRLGMTAPDTTVGIGPGGEKVTLGWNAKERKWDTLTKGALPVGVHEGETLVDPMTGETIGKGGEKSRFKENLGQIAFKSYADELKKIEDDLRFMVSDSASEPKKQSIMKAKGEAQAGAWARLQDTMKRLGYGEMFADNPATPVPKRNPNETIEEYLKRTGL